MVETKRIAVLMFPEVEELDVVGPWEVLATWAHGWPDDGYEIFTMGTVPGPLRCAHGLVVTPEHDLESAPEFQLLVVPGGRGTRDLLGDPALLEWLRDLPGRGVTIASVCTGALFLAQAGLLDGKPATTHHASLGMLRELGQDIDIQPGARFVDNGNLLTAAGVSAGIDLALHLVARMHSRERAQQVRRRIEYNPAPPV